MIAWRDIEDWPDSTPRRVAIVYQHIDGTCQSIEGDVMYDHDLGGSFIRRDGSYYNLPDNGEYVTHWADAFHVPAPLPAMS